MSWSGNGFADNWDVVWHYASQNLKIAVWAVVLGLIVALPIGILGYKKRGVYPPILVITAVIYCVPSLALILLLYVGFSLPLDDILIIIPLALYTLVILVRNIVEGLRAVPEPVKESASAMGYRSGRRLFAVELPLALPAIGAGLRVAAVSSISLVSVGALIGVGALGQLFTEGSQRDIPNEIIAGILAVVVLAIAVDVVIVVVMRVLTPWTRARR
jgi:osmoprotectant transport system permease protein